MFDIGDIVELYAATAGRKKYHLCIKVGTDDAAFQFLFLNSNPNFVGVYAVDCERVPCIPKKSDTGKTCISFNMVPRYNTHQLTLYKAKKLGTLDPALVPEILGFMDVLSNIKGLTSLERATVRSALEFIMK